MTHTHTHVSFQKIISVLYDVLIASSVAIVLQYCDNLKLRQFPACTKYVREMPRNEK